MDPRTAKRLRNHLTKKITELMITAEKYRYEEAQKPEIFPDPFDSAALETSQRSQFLSREREAQMIILLRHAIRRIDDGVFGICTACGGRISEKRLLANPTANLCIQCKEIEEKKSIK